MKFKYFICFSVLSLGVYCYPSSIISKAESVFENNLNGYKINNLISSHKISENEATVEIISAAEIDAALTTLESKEVVTEEDISTLREMINNLTESPEKDAFQIRLNNIFITKGLDRLNASSNFDVYIKSENIITMSLNTSEITFENYGGMDKMEQRKAIEITINSSLPYVIKASLEDEIRGNKGNVMRRDILKVKDNDLTEYNSFINIGESVVIKDNCDAGNNNKHYIDIELSGDTAVKPDAYRAIIKFEAIQK